MPTVKFFKETTAFEVRYIPEEVYNSLEELVNFLHYEVSDLGRSRFVRLFSRWEHGDKTSGDVVIFERRENDIYIGNIYYDDSKGEREYFVISIHKLIALMKQWDTLMDEQPDEIILSEHNGKIKLVGKNYFETATHKDVVS